MSFNFNPSKKVQEVIFSWKINKHHHPDIILNSKPVMKSSYQNIWECFWTVSVILKNMLMKYLIKQVNLLVSFACSWLFYRDHIRGFLNVTDPLCIYRTAIENTALFFLQCPNFSSAPNTFLNEIASTNRRTIDQDESKTKILELSFIVSNLFFQWQQINSWCEYEVYLGNQNIWKDQYLSSWSMRKR